ncbi:threonine-phosphate decarboxylase [Catenulispora sp. NF23]|uniref:Aminotransferase n=1 Tax=Catenulispora pinistramenti TaxID=2705254 RepID=A0ABS5L6K3_9ACTN|nr:Rv2231c family pyridoxal phosphate-dependent protein CobC [Catenulispora pinistramenti]MBS2538273.1 threonine-phosphate decarboxylase [Catenulispora pinistramenti]MBS2553755.1 threonine-phosphate decarboxylase [Catenulispora pinistramenti]
MKTATATTPTPTRMAEDLGHHGDAELRDVGIRHDFAVNVRVAEPPRWLRDRLAAGLETLAAYPDARAATEAVAERHSRSPDEVLLTSGAAEAFVLLARVLRPRHALVVHPQFTEPEAALRAAGHHVDRHLLTGDFTLDPAAVPAEADLVMLGNPTNPTSVLHPKSAVASLRGPGRTIVVDEAFMDAVPGETETLADHPDLTGVVVIRSLTKTWGLAGLRVGYILGPAPLISALRNAQPLWSVSSLALIAARAGCEPYALAEAEALAKQCDQDREHLLARLAELPDVTVPAPSRAPFVLVRTPNAAELRARLRAEGIAVRRGDTFPGLGPDWLRVAVRDRTATDLLVDRWQQLAATVRWDAG